MFNVSQTFDVNKPIVKCDDIRHNPPSLNPVKGENI